MHERGQLSNFDLIVAISIFIFVLFVLVGTWDDLSREIFESEDRRAVYYKGMDVTSLLVKTPGEPPDWDSLDVIDTKTVSAVGFASESNVLDQRKLDKFASLDNQTVKELLGLGREDFHLVIYNIEESSEVQIYSLGSDLEKPHVEVDRYALLDGEIVKLRLKLFY